MTEQYQQQLQAYLKASTMTPGRYSPSAAVKGADFVAVLAGDKPILLLGPAGDPNSLRQAEAFCHSRIFCSALKQLGLEGEVRAAQVSGATITWPESCEAVVESQSGVAEAGNAQGNLMIINLYPDRALTTLLCINTELARIIDPQVPELDNDSSLSGLADQSLQVLTLQ